ncbi:hypothetical protein JXB27_01555 [Candidatus Woesearchaeota archaeon]|nr:hypothetical protein [Candidatus Woesearchaeota archaeon]
MKKESIVEITKNQIRKRTTWALILILPYIFSEWHMRAYGLYATMPYLDKLVHFFFGVAVAAIAYLVYFKNRKFALLCTFAFSMTWEIMEIIGDKIIPQSPDLFDIFFFDGVFDIVVALIGAYLTFALLKKKF